MANYEFLRKVLGDELYKQVDEKLDGNEEIKLANLADGRYVDKDKYEKVVEENTGLKGLIDNSKTEIDTLKKSLGTGDVETKNKLAAMQEKHEAEMKALTDKMAKREFDFALSSALRDAKAKNPKTVIPLLDSEKLKHEGDKIIGFDEQIKDIRSANPFLFEEEQAPSPTGGAPFVPGKGSPSDGGFKFDFTGVREVPKK